MFKKPLKDTDPDPVEDKKPDVETVDAPVKDESKEPVLQADVESPNGVTKHVTGLDEQELKEASDAVKAEVPVVPLDINDPKHGNLTDEERQKQSS